MRVMDRDLPTSGHDPSSSAFGGANGGCPTWTDAVICGFRILDVQNLGSGGRGTDVGPGTVGPTNRDGSRLNVYHIVIYL